MIETITASNLWYVVHCKTGRELYAANILESRVKSRVYIPEMEVRVRKAVKRTPFFLGYFFIQTNLRTVPLSHINSSPGVLKLLDFGDGPLAVPEELIEVVREEIGRLNAPRSLPHHRLSPGDQVRITGGPMEGLDAVFIEALTSGERARVLLHFLGRLSKLQVDMNSLEKVGHEYFHLERRTRGKGRKINSVKITFEGS